jgi:hypothetical protein
MGETPVGVTPLSGTPSGCGMFLGVWTRGVRRFAPRPRANIWHLYEVRILDPKGIKEISPASNDAGLIERNEIRPRQGVAETCDDVGCHAVVLHLSEVRNDFGSLVPGYSPALRVRPCANVCDPFGIERCRGRRVSTSKRCQTLARRRMTPGLRDDMKSDPGGGRRRHEITGCPCITA